MKASRRAWYEKNRDKVNAARREKTRIQREQTPKSYKRVKRETQVEKAKKIYRKAIEADRQKKLDFIMARWEYIQNTYNPTQNNQYPRIPQSETQQSKTEVRQTSEIPLGINP